MKSTEKLLAFLEQMQDLPDTELREAIPMLTPSTTRIALTLAAGQVPQDPEQLDGYMATAARFVVQMRSDDAAPLELVEGALPEPAA